MNTSFQFGETWFDFAGCTVTAIDSYRQPEKDIGKRDFDESLHQAIRGMTWPSPGSPASLVKLLLSVETPDKRQFVVYVGNNFVRLGTGVGSSCL